MAITDPVLREALAEALAKEKARLARNEYQRKYRARKKLEAKLLAPSRPRRGRSKPQASGPEIAPRSLPFPNPGTQFKPGNSASPGRPPKRLSATYRELLGEVLDASGLTEGELIGRNLLMLAKQKDDGQLAIAAAKELRQATEGSTFTHQFESMTEEQLDEFIRQHTAAPLALGPGDQASAGDGPGREGAEGEAAAEAVEGVFTDLDVDLSEIARRQPAD